MPMGAPGWPDLAFSTASILKTLMAWANSLRLGICFSSITYLNLL